MNVAERYHLPLYVQYCKRCTMSNQRPRITFDQEGICSACHYSDFKKTIDWQARELELQALCDKHRKGNGDYDVIVPCSGGKDSGFVAHQLKKYGMTPLTVTWAPLKATEIGVKGLGLGLPKPEEEKQAGTVESLAERLVTALNRQRSNVHVADGRDSAHITVDAEVVRVPNGS